MKSKKKSKPGTHLRIRQALRKLWLWSDVRRDCLRAAKVGKSYECAECQGLYRAKDVQVDHIVAVGATPGSRNATEDTSWDVFIARMFCGIDGLQVLCTDCHLNKKETGNGSRVKEKESREDRIRQTG